MKNRMKHTVIDEAYRQDKRVKLLVQNQENVVQNL